MKLAVAAAAVVCALAASGASASTARTPTPKAATAAFGRLLHQLYGGIHGYWTCPRGQIGVGGGDGCLGELHSAGAWHQVSAVASFSHGVTWINRVSAQTWQRHWSPYSRHYILRSNEPQVPGVVSVNSPAYDWGWLAMVVRRLKAGHTGGFSGFDGNAGGLQRFYGFTCSRNGGLITCRNSLGDAMRYRPHPT